MSRQVAVAGRDWQLVTGTPAEVAAAVRAARATGRLEAMTTPHRVPGHPRRVYVHIRMREPQRRVWPAAVAGGVALAAIAAVTVLAVAWMVAHWQMLLGAAVVAAVVLAGLGRVGVCPGIHCPGCRHR